MQRMQQKQKEAVEGLGMEGAVPSVPSVASVLPNEKTMEKTRSVSPVSWSGNIGNNKLKPSQGSLNVPIEHHPTIR